MSQAETVRRILGDPRTEEVTINGETLILTGPRRKAVRPLTKKLAGLKTEGEGKDAAIAEESLPDMEDIVIQAVMLCLSDVSEDDVFDLLDMSAKDEGSNLADTAMRLCGLLPEESEADPTNFS